MNFLPLFGPAQSGAALQTDMPESSRVGFTRRHALIFGLSMGAAAVAGEMGRAPVPDPTRGEGSLLGSIFPEQFGDWTIDRQSHSIVRTASGRERILEAYDQLLERTFVNPAGYRVMLSVASSHGTTASMQLHMPEVCYGVNGYRISDPQSQLLPIAGRSVPVRRLRTEMPGRVEPVTYWMAVAGRIATDFGPEGYGSWDFRLQRLAYALRREAMSGMLVRVSSIDRDLPRAYAVQADFADAMVRAIAAQQQPRVVGEVA